MQEVACELQQPHERQARAGLIAGHVEFRAGGREHGMGAIGYITRVGAG